MHSRVSHGARQFIYGHRMTICQSGQRQDLGRSQVGHSCILRPEAAVSSGPGPAVKHPAGRPVEPRNLVRSFARVCKDHGIRLIPVHAIRHTVATLLKALKVPPRDAQAILGHAHVSTTQQIYTYVDEPAQREALTRLNQLLGGSE